MEKGKHIGSRVMERVAIEAKFMWNLVDPRHGRATVYVSKQTGEVVRKEKPPTKR